MATAATVITAGEYDLREYAGQKLADAEKLEYLNRSLIALDTELLSMDSDWVHQTLVSIGLTAGLQKVAQPTRCVSIRSIWVTDIIDSFTDLTYTAAGDTIATAAGTFSTNGIAVNQTIGLDGSTSNDTHDIGLISVSAVTETLITVNENVIVDEGAANASGTIFAQQNKEVHKKSTDTIFEKRKWNSGTSRPYYFAHEGTNVIFDYKADQAYGLFIHFNQKTAALATGTTMPYNDEFNEALREGMVFLAKHRNDDADNVSAALERHFKTTTMRPAVRRNFIPKRHRLDF